MCCVTHTFLTSHGTRARESSLQPKMADDADLVLPRISPAASAAPTVRGYRIRSGGQSCWHSLSIALISSFNALAIIFFVKSAFVFGDGDYVDNVIERCGAANQDGEQTAVTP